MASWASISTVSTDLNNDIVDHSGSFTKDDTLRCLHFVSLKPRSYFREWVEDNRDNLVDLYEVFKHQIFLNRLPHVKFQLFAQMAFRCSRFHFVNGKMLKNNLPLDSFNVNQIIELDIARDVVHSEVVKEELANEVDYIASLFFNVVTSLVLAVMEANKCNRVSYFDRVDTFNHLSRQFKEHVYFILNEIEDGTTTKDTHSGDLSDE